MSNTAAVLNGLLATQLRDTTYATWTSAEMDSLISQAVANLYPRIVIPLLPESYTQTLAKGVYSYAIPAAIVGIAAVDGIDSSLHEVGRLEGGIWRVEGNLMSGTAKIRIAPDYVDGLAGGYIRYTAYGRYDTVTNLIPDDYVKQVLAAARAEAYRRMGADRARYKQWSDSEPTLNTSINELVEMINDAQREADSWKATQKTWRRPVPGRVG